MNRQHQQKLADSCPSAYALGDKGLDMIYRLRLANFYSVFDAVDINLAVPASVPDEPDRFPPIFPGSKIRAPKVVGIYGPNAAGKSNLLRGIGLVSWFVQHSFHILPDISLPCHRFGSAEGNARPVEIEVEFAAPVDLLKSGDKGAARCRYAYYLALDGDGSQPNRVTYESLVHWPPTATRRVKVFERHGDGSVTSARSFRLHGYAKPLKAVLRPNASLISTLVQLGHEPSKALASLASEVFTNILLERQDLPDNFVAQQYSQRPDLLARLNREIQRLDFGIKEVVIQQTSHPGPVQNFQPKFFHTGLANALPSSSESHGTRQFFRVFPLIARALETGGVASIDELDSSIHPLILPEIIRWFFDPVRNKHHAQLWFTCQNPYLLTELAKEEILFCEKDELGRTSAFGLGAIRSVRRIDNYAKKYLGGAYGAVPHIG